MASKTVLLLLGVSLFFGGCHGLFNGCPQDNFFNRFTSNLVKVFTTPKTVTLQAVNSITGTTFDVSFEVECTEQNSLIAIMDEAISGGFEYALVARDGNIAEVTMVNGEFRTSGTNAWNIYDNDDMDITDQVLSTYIPSHEDTIRFQLEAVSVEAGAPA